MFTKTIPFSLEPSGAAGVFAIPACRHYGFVSTSGDLVLLTQGLIDPDDDPTLAQTFLDHGVTWPENLPFSPMQAPDHGMNLDPIWIQVPNGGVLKGVYVQNTTQPPAYLVQE